MNKILFLLSFFCMSFNFVSAQDKCDVNGDGSVDVKDINMVVEHICSNHESEEQMITVDGKSYVINTIDPSSGSPQRKIQYMNSPSGIGVEIATVDKSVSFPTYLDEVYCTVQLKLADDDRSEVNAIIKCSKNGNTYQCIISDLAVGSHTLSLTFNDDITKYPDKE